MSWTEDAKNTVREQGFHDKDSDYGGAIGKALDELINVFGKQRHSGFSAHWVADLFHKLVENDGYLTKEEHDKALKEWMKKEGLDK